jgi:hypothetical protein
MMHFKTFLRRLRAEQARLIWKWSQITRKPPQNIAALQAERAAAERAHKPRVHIDQQIRAARHAQMKGLTQ